MRKYCFIFISILTIIFFTLSCDLMMKTEKKDSKGKGKSHHSNNNSNGKAVDVTNLQVEKTYNDGEIRCDGQIKLSWNEPTDTSFQYVEITSTPPVKGKENPFIVYKAYNTTQNSANLNNIVNGVNYTFTVRIVYYPDNIKSTGVSVNITGEDLIAPTFNCNNFWTSSRENGIIIGGISILSYDSAERIEITYLPAVVGISQPIIMDINKDGGTYLIDGLAAETNYNFTLRILDPSDNKSVVYNFAARPSAPPSEVDNLNAISGNGKVTLTWDDPPEGDFDYVRIHVYYTGNTTPIISLYSTVDEGIETKEITGLTNNYSYDFKISTVDDYGSYSAGKTISCTPTP